MNEQERRNYLDRYQEKKERGVLFFPDLIFKDALVALLIFIALVALAYFLGAPLEERANPADSNYTPRPEWYFLFLFQLLKYFPGSLEVIGVFVIPTVAIILLITLPFLDRSAKRHFRARIPILAVTTLLAVGIVGLTVQAMIEIPPPAEVAEGDPIAALYASNCATCHGPSVRVTAGMNLHEIIARGSHDGMPAWSADLSSDQIDALVGFILSPRGNSLFVAQCSACHDVPQLVASDPLELKNALEQGQSYSAHEDVEVPEWSESMTGGERTSLLNFLVAPDGQRLFATNCASCHGRAVAFSGNETDLRSIISEGGLHLEMPPWQELISAQELDTLAAYVVNPGAEPQGASLFEQNCANCHGARVPLAESFEQARQVIASGGAHETMPVWGEVLTAEQLDALVGYTLSAAEGTSTEIGQELYSQYCASCHGEFGEGGVNPTLPGDVIAPISSSEYLQTRDDLTLKAIIAQGQPNFGMSPFGTTYGGPLDDDQVDAIVSFLRAWEADPPVELPPEVEVSTVPINPEDIFLDLCAQCHNEDGTGGIGPSLVDVDFQTKYSDQEIFNVISEGHAATPMIAWGEILTSAQIQDLVDFIRNLDVVDVEPELETTPEGEVGAVVSFTGDVLPILDEYCASCHGTLGGWDASTHEAVINSGINGPAVIPGDVDGSLLAQKILGTQTQGAIMPPAGLMPEDIIQIILDWIAAGAPDN